jgi:hypothetical protein
VVLGQHSNLLQHTRCLLPTGTLFVDVMQREVLLLLQCVFV